jgi:hypothetical protein
MPFDDPNNRIDSLNAFETTLSIIKSLVERFSSYNISTISLGDLNSDIFRHKRFDKLLLNFILDNNLLNLSQLFTQKIDHTYPNDFVSTNSPKCYIDHVLINEKALINFLSIQFNIVDDLANMSGHKALITTLEIWFTPELFELKKQLTYQKTTNNIPKKYTGRVFIENWDLDSTLYH